MNSIEGTGRRENGQVADAAQRGIVITVKADLLSPLIPLLDELDVSCERKVALLEKLALRNYNRGNYILRDALMFAVDM